MVKRGGPQEVGISMRTAATTIPGTMKTCEKRGTDTSIMDARSAWSEECYAISCLRRYGTLLCMDMR
ncbi:hypothetical protein KSZ_54250 [Dictyobacter formicarum]|uniref:Uncharacterized protein n=1 Tax=Dictyobacter formicarum TaxID=2778368 RepID=A0ABQ3VMH9_9CHLR|nr:hypothetical protein KSZ_54250 [Dictyobacter formicarum]